MGKNQYLIRLNDAQRDLLNRIICEEGQTERAIMRAKILLRSDLSAHRRASLLQVAEELGTSHTTVLTVRTEFHKIGMEKAVYRKERSNNIKTRRINTQVREQLVEMTRQDPPAGNKRWTLRLLASEAVNQGIVTHISLDTMASILRNAGIVLK